MKTIVSVLILAIHAMFFISCEKEPQNTGLPTTDSLDVNVYKEKISGYVQKGPFNNGTDIMVYELNNKLEQTGNSFNTQITNNSGLFELNSIKLQSNYVEIKASGFYFNEVSNNNSVAQLTLYAISDITNKSDINVNVLSHLEKARVQQLIQDNYQFNDAKDKALHEVLKIFKFHNTNIFQSELLNISENTNDNAILLAVSVILVGNRTDAELSQLLADIISDIKNDGTLDNDNIGSDLVNHAKYLNLNEIRDNIENKYSDLGIDADIPDFESYVNFFLDSSGYEVTNYITYPEFSTYGENILYNNKNEFYTYKEYSLAADIPIGNSLKIIIKGGLWGYEVIPNGPINWEVSEYSFSALTQTFTSIESGKSCDLKISFDHTTTGDSITIEYYENEAENPTKIKKVSVEEQNPNENSEIIYPLEGGYGLNILNSENDTFYTNEIYSITALLSESKYFRIELDGAFVDTTTSINWNVYGYNEELTSMSFYTNYEVYEYDMKIIFPDNGIDDRMTYIYFYESMSEVPDYEKIIWIMNPYDY